MNVYHVALEIMATAQSTPHQHLSILKSLWIYLIYQQFEVPVKTTYINIYIFLYIYMYVYICKYVHIYMCVYQKHCNRQNMTRVFFKVIGRRCEA